MINQNIGPVDRCLRTAIGVAIVFLAFWNDQPLWGCVGLLPLVTAYYGWTPVYFLWTTFIMRPKQKVDCAETRPVTNGTDEDERR